MTPHPVLVRPTEAPDIPGIIELCRRVYPNSQPYGRDQLESHLAVFPEGQLTAVEETAGDGSGDGEDAGAAERVVGMAASLIVAWEDYDFELAWRDFTDHGYFTNHDPAGRTLYGAEVMVDPTVQSRGVGSRLYTARDELLGRLGLRRIRAGARLRGYGAHAERMSAEEYVARVIRGEIRDPTLTFQLNRGFNVVAVVSGYLANDPASRGWAAVIEKLNPELATEEEMERSRGRFRADSFPAEPRAEE